MRHVTRGGFDAHELLHAMRCTWGQGCDDLGTESHLANIGTTPQFRPGDSETTLMRCDECTASPATLLCFSASFEREGDSGAQETKCGQGYVRFGDDDDDDDGDDYDPRPGEGATGAARSSKGNCELID